MSSKKLLLIAITYFISYSAECQSTVEKGMQGVWQLGSSVVSAGLLDHYKFYGGNKFEFRPSDYQGLSRTMSLVGSYLIKTDSLILNVESMKVLVGGKPDRTSTSGGSGWEINGGNIETRNFDKPIRFSLTLKTCSNKKEECLMFDSVLFYKIQL